MFFNIESSKRYNYLIVMPRLVEDVGAWYIFPLGIPYVSSCLKQAGFNVYTLNLNDECGNVSKIIQKYIGKYDIDVVLTGGLSIEYFAIKEILYSVKQYSSDIITIVGGGIITSVPEVGMKVLEYADYGIIGEGEITTTELCYALENAFDINEVNGLVFYGSGHELMRTMPRQEIKDLSLIPFPDYDGFGFRKVTEMMFNELGINTDHAVLMSGSRSCPFQCTFCFHPSGNHYRQRSLDNFFEELDLLVGKYGVKYIFITDELFANKIDRVKEFCSRIKPYNIQWLAQFRVCDITEEMVMMLKDANCSVMGFGLESADNRILKSMRKGITIEQTEKALALVYKYGMQIQGGFIFGDKEETLETATNTLNWWKAHSEYSILLNFITAYPGTPLYKYAVEQGIIADEVQFIKDGCPVVNLSKMSEDEVKWLGKQIIELPQKTYVLPGGAEIEFNNVRKSVSVKGKCISCGAENSWPDVQLFSRNFLGCCKCGRRYRIPIPEKVIESVNKNVENLLHKHNNLAFWGCNNSFIDFASHLHVLSNSKNCYLIDIAETKQGIVVGNKVISSPDIISKENIDAVVISAVSYLEVIKKQVTEDYPNIKTYSLLDLIDIN